MQIETAPSDELVAPLSVKMSADIDNHDREEDDDDIEDGVLEDDDDD